MTWKIVPDISDEEASEIDAEIRKKARFLIDENSGPRLVEVVRSEGYRVVDVRDVNLDGHSDSDLFNYAWKHNYVLLTHDADFLNDRDFPLNRCPGVVVLPDEWSYSFDVDEVVFGILIHAGEHRNSLWHQKILVSDEYVWTMKGWDKSSGRHYRNRYKFGPDGELWIWEDAE